MAVITIIFGNRSRLIGLPESYAALIGKARQVFKTGDAELLIYVTLASTDQEVELDPSAYEAVSHGCSLRVTEKLDSSDCDSDSEQFNDLMQADTPGFDFLISVRTLTGRTIRVRVTRIMTVIELKEKIQAVEGIACGNQRLIHAGTQMENSQPLHAYRVLPTTVLHLIFVPTMRGGKPAIYLMSPVRLSNVSVQVTLSHHWEFSIMYPLVKPALESGEQSSVSWQVSADPNGTLKDKATGVECSYLYWEAKTTATPHFLPGCPFNPQSPHILRAGRNACILPFADFVPYLDQTLTMLTLSPAMRTEFMVYWLPKFQGIRDRGLDIAFDFVHQAAFDKVAKLSVDPQPKTVARIFLLFDGVPKDSGESLSRAELDAIDWPSKIGMDAEGMRDEGAFRVLEWGGMQAHGI